MTDIPAPEPKRRRTRDDAPTVITTPSGETPDARRARLATNAANAVESVDSSTPESNVRRAFASGSSSDDDDTPLRSDETRAMSTSERLVLAVEHVAHVLEIIAGPELRRRQDLYSPRRPTETVDVSAPADTPHADDVVRFSDTLLNELEATITGGLGTIGALDRYECHTMWRFAQTAGAARVERLFARLNAPTENACERAGCCDAVREQSPRCPACWSICTTYFALCRALQTRRTAPGPRRPSERVDDLLAEFAGTPRAE